ncbi:uncharacterized protein LOC131657549 [Vicia villosa]|uniref:uncharacterized protein LOC131657549 n=1 Tax=Vicia villosa TaxID=3911 RepID=UPI00273B39F5|nr:uncharacterized protein LOC131657549 [Vicia villosa]
MKLGDGNNKYFHACIKAKNKIKKMSMLQAEDVTELKTKAKIEKEVMLFYKNMMGKADAKIDGIDTTVLIEGPQLSNVKTEFLTTTITNDEIEKALRSICDLKAPRVDGYEAYFFKVTWSIMKHDVLRAVHDCFLTVRM